MECLLREIKDSIGKNDDFIQMDQQLGDLQVQYLGLKSLLDFPKTILAIKENLGSESLNREAVLKQLSTMGVLKKQEKNELISSILEGKLIIYIKNERESAVTVDPISQTLTRGIESPANENVLQGPLSSFNEEIQINTGLIRKQIVSENLQVRSYSIGTSQKKSLSLLYCNDHVNLNLLQKIIFQIEKNLTMDLNNAQDVSKLMGISFWSVISPFTTTEVPQEASMSLLKGRIVLLVDRMPFAMILPSVLWDMFANENDRNFPFPLMVSIRSLRIIGLLMTLIIPGLYVALVSVNPEVLRIELALSIAQSREGVPYPALIEMIIMLLILELIIEASVRLPKSIGPTITMVGGIILGQAAVEAKLVSNLLIIILAATTIANSTIIGFQNSISIRLFKYIILIFASIYGVLGILAGIFFICIYLASINTLGVPFLYINFSKDEIKSG
ncbi:spore germination protein [Metabacillus idriensis]|uniref:spore germination protein n=1 Tax=Metabacillus idriensis TaxID=324768 RepID=UPI003D2B48D1